MAGYDDPGAEEVVDTPPGIHRVGSSGPGSPETKELTGRVSKCSAAIHRGPGSGARDRSRRTKWGCRPLAPGQDLRRGYSVYSSVHLAQSDKARPIGLTSGAHIGPRRRACAPARLLTSFGIPAGNGLDHSIQLLGGSYAKTLTWSRSVGSSALLRPRNPFQHKVFGLDPGDGWPETPKNFFPVLQVAPPARPLEPGAVPWDHHFRHGA